MSEWPTYEPLYPPVVLDDEPTRIALGDTPEFVTPQDDTKVRFTGTVSMLQGDSAEIQLDTPVRDGQFVLEAVDSNGYSLVSVVESGPPGQYTSVFSVCIHDPQGVPIEGTINWTLTGYK